MLIVNVCSYNMPDGESWDVLDGLFSSLL